MRLQPLCLNMSHISRRKRQREDAALKKVLLKLLLLCLLFAITLQFLLGVRVLYGNSGFPSVRDGDLVIYRIFAKNSIRRGDVVLCRFEEAIVPARVIGLPGETVDITEQGVTINGVLLAEETMYPTELAENGCAFPLTVTEDTLFLLHDYRSDRSDGRSYGATPMAQIVGAVVLLVRWRGF